MSKKYLLVLVPRKMLYLHGSIEEHHDHLHGFCNFLPKIKIFAEEKFFCKKKISTKKNFQQNFLSPISFLPKTKNFPKKDFPK